MQFVKVKKRVDEKKRREWKKGLELTSNFALHHQEENNKTSAQDQGTFFSTPFPLSSYFHNKNSDTFTTRTLILSQQELKD